MKPKRLHRARTKAAVTEAAARRARSQAGPPDWMDRSVHPTRLAANLFRKDAPPRQPSLAHCLQPGDSVRVVAWGGPPINDTLVVTQEGDLGLPGIGVLPVRGKTVLEAQALVVAGLRVEFRDAGAIIAVEQNVPQGVIVAVRCCSLAMPAPGKTLRRRHRLGRRRRTWIQDPARHRSSMPARRRSSTSISQAAAGHPAAICRSSLLMPAASMCAGELPSVMFFGAVKRQLTIKARLPGETLDKALATTLAARAGAGTQHIQPA